MIDYNINIKIKNIKYILFFADIFAIYMNIQNDKMQRNNSILIKFIRNLQI